jgi:protein-histidine N-methyltransferase
MHDHGWMDEGELALSPSLIESFLNSLHHFGVRISFFSGAWSTEFMDLIQLRMGLNVTIEADTENMNRDLNTKGLLIVGAETIYSPSALESFANILMSILQSGSKVEKKMRRALVAAKRVYFGVGGSMQDFCTMVQEKGGVYNNIREEDVGVRRTVIEVWGSTRIAESGSPSETVLEVM